MKATLLPLDRKYYGTRIRIEEDGDYDDITIWLSWDEPSEREYRDYWRNEDGEYEWEGSHCESAKTLRVARAIVEAINKR